MLACLFAVFASGSFVRFHCDVFHFFFLHDVFLFFLSLQAQKQFHDAARFVFPLTATEQLQTQVLSAAYPHLPPVSQQVVESRLTDSCGQGHKLRRAPSLQACHS